MSTSVSSVTKHFPSAENGFTTTLASTISSGATTVPLNSVAGYSNGEVAVFIVDPTDVSKKQAFTGTIDTAGVQVTGVVWTSGTNQTHTAGSTVVDYASATHISMMSKGLLVEHKQTGLHSDVHADTLAVSGATTLSGALTGTTASFTSVSISGTSTSQGWTALGQTPNTVTANSSVPKVFDMVFNGVDLTGTLSNGMKLQCARTVAAPSKCTDLEASSSQYYSKSSPSGMTFTDDFVVSAWIKVESYGSEVIASRYNGTSGWSFELTSAGQVALYGFNAGSANHSEVTSYASVPLNKWVHVAAQLDMSTFTATTTTSYVMFDGVDVAAVVARSGTNPTALVQAGNLEIGGRNGGLLPFDGKIAQVAIYSAKVTQATILASKNQTLSGSETSLISAYSFNNSINDLNANANNLTAQNSAVATNADSPFANAVSAGSLEYAEVLNVSFSTNTTVTVRVPDGCQIPTTGGISSVYYSTQNNPYGLPFFSKILSNARIHADFAIASATPTQVSGLTCPVYIPAGATVKLTLIGNMFNSGANSNILAIWDGVVNSGTKVQASNIDFDAGSKARATSTGLILTPTSGAKTFNAGLSANAGTATLQGAITYPANLQVELI